MTKPTRKTITRYPDGRVVEVIEYEALRNPYDMLPNVWPPPQSGGITQGRRCLWDDAIPGRAYGMVCPCPKCTPTSY